MAQEVESKLDVESTPPTKRLFTGISSKLLLLTFLFVMFAELLVFIPSFANYRNTWLKEHLLTAEAASIVYLDATDISLSDKAGSALLRATESITVAIRQDGISLLMATERKPGDLMEAINLDEADRLQSIMSSFAMLFAKDEQQYRVYARMRSSNSIMELVQESSYVKRALWAYARNIFLLSLVIAICTSGLVYFVLYWLIVRPIIKISSSMDEFSKQPENAAIIYKPGARVDEIGLAEERLSLFQQELHNTLKQKKRLADLGLAVSKINHDLRNILASAQLFSDRLMSLPDPTVQRFAPKLIRTIDRAVDYTQSVMSYGKALEAPPKRRKLLLHDIANEVAESLGLEGTSSIKWQNKISKELQINADPEQIFRVLMNLCRNSVQAMNDADNERQDTLTVSSETENGSAFIRVTDTGPGIPESIREKIFNAFEGSTKSGGTGLGMAIAVELIHAHGGTIKIEETSPGGTTFLIELVEPDADENAQDDQEEFLAH